MEKVTVKLVVFKHPEPEKWPIYCSYCPAINEYQGRSNTKRLKRYLIYYFPISLTLKNFKNLSGL